MARGWETRRRDVDAGNPTCACPSIDRGSGNREYTSSRVHRSETMKKPGHIGGTGVHPEFSVDTTSRDPEVEIHTTGSKPPRSWGRSCDSCSLPSRGAFGVVGDGPRTSPCPHVANGYKKNIHECMFLNCQVIEGRDPWQGGRTGEDPQDRDPTWRGNTVPLRRPVEPAMGHPCACGSSPVPEKRSTCLVEHSRPSSQRTTEEFLHALTIRGANP